MGSWKIRPVITGIITLILIMSALGTFLHMSSVRRDKKAAAALVRQYFASAARGDPVWEYFLSPERVKTPQNLAGYTILEVDRYEETGFRVVECLVTVRADHLVPRKEFKQDLDSFFGSRKDAGKEDLDNLEGNISVVTFYRIRCWKPVRGANVPKHEIGRWKIEGIWVLDPSEHSGRK